MELRLYQTPNLLDIQKNEVTISGPAPKANEWAVTNLITNLEVRTPGNNINPYLDFNRN